MNNIDGIFRTPTELAWLVLDLNSFFASCEQQENESLRGKPIIVVPAMVDTTCAIAASYPAKAFGIKTGTLVHEAKQLCPDLVIVPARHKLYVEYHHKIIAAIERCIPVDEVMSIDEVACRLDRIQRAPEEARTLALAIKDSIQKSVGICFTSSIGIASNRLLAKLGSNMQKPDGLTILQPQDLPQAILHLSVRELPGVGRNMEARLQQAGLGTMGALWGASAERLRQVWGGIVGVKYHALLHGADLGNAERPRRSISHQHVLEPAARRLDKARPILRQLLTRAAQRLRSDGFYCSRLSVDIKGVRDQGYWDSRLDVRETQDTGLLLQALEQIWQDAPASLTPLRIGITLSGLVPSGTHQPDLFTPQKIIKPLAIALDTLNSKYGADTIAYGAGVTGMISKIAFQRVPELKEL